MVQLFECELDARGYTPYQRPEAVIRISKDLVALGKNNAAIDTLCEAIISKRNRNWTKGSEDLVIYFLDLAMEKQMTLKIKNTLYQYKNATQHNSAELIENVIAYFLDNANTMLENTLEDTKAVLQEVCSSNLPADTILSPEQLMMTALELVCNEDDGTKKKELEQRLASRTVASRFQFTWECYRTALDVLRNNPRLEEGYHRTALLAIDFCYKHQRKQEFKRLCENIRSHLHAAHRTSDTKKYNIDLSNPATLEKFSETRFAQLNVAVSMNLWHDACRTVEDIHELIVLSKKTPKMEQLVSYFEKLSLVFWKTQHYNFHAYARQSLFDYHRDNFKHIDANTHTNTNTTENMRLLADHVILSALATPLSDIKKSVFSISPGTSGNNSNSGASSNTQSSTSANGAPSGGGRGIESDERFKKLSYLVSRQGVIPQRATLLSSAAKNNILQLADPRLRQIYTWMEHDFHPLQICSKVMPVLTEYLSDMDRESTAKMHVLMASENIMNPDIIRLYTSFNKYLAPIQDVLVTKVVQQVSTVYEHMKIESLLSVIPFYTAPALEKYIEEAVQLDGLSIKIDQQNKILTFTHTAQLAQLAHTAPPGTSSVVSYTSETMVSGDAGELVSLLAHQLTLVPEQVDVAENKRVKEDTKRQIKEYLLSVEAEHQAILHRKEVIEHQKIEAERLAESLLLRQEEEAAQKKEQLRIEEETRYAQMLKDRTELELLNKRKKVRAEDNKIKLEKLIASLNGDESILKIFSQEELDTLDYNELLGKHISFLNKESLRAATKTAHVLLSHDYFERAVRDAELPGFEATIKETSAKNNDRSATLRDQHVAKLQLVHSVESAIKTKLARIKPDKDVFCGLILEKEQTAHQQALHAWDLQRARLFEERKAQIILHLETAQKAAEEAERARIEQARIKKAEEDAAAARTDEIRRQKEADRVEVIRKQKELDDRIEAMRQSTQTNAAPVLQRGKNMAPATPATTPATSPMLRGKYAPPTMVNAPTGSKYVSPSAKYTPPSEQKWGSAGASSHAFKSTNGPPPSPTTASVSASDQKWARK